MLGWECAGRAATGLWSESAAGRRSCRALGLLPTPEEEGTFSQVPDSSPRCRRHLPWVLWTRV